MRELAQYSVTDRMPECVVDAFEVVEVQKHYDQPTLFTQGALMRLFKQLVEGTTVGQSGKRVNTRLVYEFPMRLLLTGSRRIRFVSIAPASVG